MWKTLSITFIFLFLTITINAQNIKKSKEFYSSAKKNFRAEKHNQTLNDLTQSVTTGGGSNAFIQVLRVQCYIAQNDWKKAQNALYKSYQYKIPNRIKDNLTSLSTKIDNHYKNIYTATVKKRKEEKIRQSKTRKAKFQHLKKEEINEKARSNEDDIAWRKTYAKNTLKEYKTYLNTAKYTNHRSEAKKYTIEGKGHKTYYNNGQLKVIGNLLDGNLLTGKKIGNWKNYYENGQLSEILSYVNGKLNGQGAYYYDNGKLDLIGNHKNGFQTGIWKYYYKNGQLQGIGNHENLERGQQTGLWKYYYENGQLKKIGSYETNVWNYYASNGIQTTDNETYSLELLQKALILEPTNVIVLENFARYYHTSFYNFKKAKFYYEKIQKLKSTDFDVNLALGTLYVLERNKTIEALKYIEKNSSTPLKPEIEKRYGELYSKKLNITPTTIRYLLKSIELTKNKKTILVLIHIYEGMGFLGKEDKLIFFKMRDLLK